VKEYSAFGIRNVWVIDPENRTAFTGSADGLKEVSSGWLEVPGTAIRIAVADLFAEMDRA
jgi:Uma2 family endonuclease